RRACAIYRTPSARARGRRGKNAGGRERRPCGETGKEALNRPRVTSQQKLKRNRPPARPASGVALRCTGVMQVWPRSRTVPCNAFVTKDPRLGKRAYDTA